MRYLEATEVVDKTRTSWPLAEMAVGDRIMICKGESGFSTARNYAYVRGMKLGRKFSCNKTEGGLVITRTA